MLYDSRRDRFPILMRFISWLRIQPPDQTYYWPNSKRCACCQFGWEQVRAAWEDEGVDLNGLARGSLHGPSGDLAGEWTFGKLLVRAEARLADMAAALADSQ